MRNQRKRRPKIGVALVASALLGLTACGGGSGGSGSGSGGVIKVAVLAAQSGDLTTLDVPGTRGATMAMDKVNDAGGIKVNGKTYKFDYTVTDLQSDPTVAAAAAQKAITGGAQVIVSSSFSALADPVAGAVRRSGNKVLMLGPATVLDKYTGPNSMIFRTLLNDTAAAKQYIPALHRLFPEVTKISGLMINDAIGQSVMSIYPPVFEGNGIKVVSQDTFPPDESNFAPLLQRTPADVQGFFVGYTDAAVLGVAQAAQEAGRSTVFFTRGTTCQVGVQLGAAIQALACQVLGEDPLAPSTSQAKDFFAAYEKKFNTKVDTNSGAALYTYDWMSLLAKGFEKAGTTDNMSSVAKALRGASYDGVLHVGFTKDGASDMRLKVGVVRKGQLTITPGGSAG